MLEKHRGHFLVLEGIDGSGKSTQIKLLNDWLKSEGYTTILTKEPWDGGSRTEIKEMISEAKMTNNPAEIAKAFAEDRKYHLEQLIKPSLSEGKIVISDRYLYSSLVYQVVDGLELEWIKSLNREAIMPDLCIILDIPAEISLKRILKSEIHQKEKSRFEVRSTLEKIRKEYLKQSRNYPEVRIVDASGQEYGVHRLIKDVVKHYFDPVGLRVWKHK